MPNTVGGGSYGVSFQPGISYADQLTIGGYSDLGSQPTGAPTAPAVQAGASKTKPLYYVLAIFLLLVVLKYTSEHEKAGMEPKIVGVGVYNMFAITIMAMFGIIIFKIGFNKYQVDGMTDLVNMV